MQWKIWIESWIYWRKNMKNIVLDLMMGFLCVVLTITLIGIIIIPEVLEQWAVMRNEQKK